MQTDPTAAGFDPKRLEYITSHLQSRYIEPGKLAGCQTLVARHGTLAHFSSLGFADRERNVPMSEETIFRIYSMTKPITSVALMQLYERAEFQLTDPVHRVIPSWRSLRVWEDGEGSDMQSHRPQQPMNFRNILSHTSGLQYGGGNDHPVSKAYQAAGFGMRQPSSLEDLIERLADVPLRYAPGSAWLYSLSTDVCGYLVEAISGLRFDRYLQQHIFDPLGMHDTGFTVPAASVDRFSANYARGPSKTLRLLDDPKTSSYLNEKTYFSGGGGLVGTTLDYWRFCEMLRGGGTLDGNRILGSRTISLMTQNHLRDGKDLSDMAIGAFSETPFEGIGFGLGFAVTLDPVRASQFGASDYFWGGAASTIFWIDPVEDLVVIFMTQFMPSNTFNVRGQLKNIVYSAITE